jgi:hypothetical protein
MRLAKKAEPQVPLSSAREWQAIECANIDFFYCSATGGKFFIAGTV